MKAFLILPLAIALCAPARAADPLAAETPNGALRIDLPPGWTAKPLGNGLALEPPPLRAGERVPLDEMIVVACEPFPVKSLEDRGVKDLIERLKAGQLASVEGERGQRRERVKVGEKSALVTTYRGTDDSGLPAVLHIAVLPDEGRAAVLTARLPLARADLRARDLEAILLSMRIRPAAEEKALKARLAGTWRSDGGRRITLALRPDGTFEESREAPPGAPFRAGVWEVIGREVRLRYDEGPPWAFRVDAEPEPGTFVAGSLVWKRAAP